MSGRRVDGPNDDENGFGIDGPGALSQTYTGTEGNDRLVGGGGSDQFYMGQGGDDYVDGGAGNDDFDFSSGLDAGDRVIGGDGNDAIVIGSLSALTVTDQMMTGIESISVKLPGEAEVRITIGPTVTNESGRLGIGAYGLASFDFAVSAAGNALDITFAPGSGSAELMSGNGDDLFEYRAGCNGVFDGSAGRDRISFLYFDENAINVDLSLTTTQSVGDGTIRVTNVDDIIGTAGADVIRGTGGDNWIAGRGGGDLLQGFGGNDLITTGVVSTPSGTKQTYVDGGSGFDIVGLSPGYPNYMGVAVNLNNHGYQDTGRGVFRLLGIEGVSATDYNDTIAGGDQKNTLYGGGGDDVLNGQGGADILYGDSGIVTEDLFGYKATPTVVEADDPGGDTLKGGSGNDLIYGEGGNDRLAGGLGADRLWGGDDFNTFVYTATTESRGHGVDLIGDFSSALDRLDVFLIDADVATSGNQSFHLGATAGYTGDILFAFDPVAHVTSVTFYIDGDARPDMLVKLAGQVTLDATNFVF